jgi:hypothetical protein
MCVAGDEYLFHTTLWQAPGLASIILNRSLKEYPEVVAMCKKIIQRGVAGLSTAEASQAVYLVAFLITQKTSSLSYSLSILINSKNIVMIDDGLLARLLKVAIEMEF